MTDKQIAEELWQILLMIRRELNTHWHESTLHSDVWDEVCRRAKLANPDYRL
jgi:hypothetical protein